MSLSLSGVAKWKGYLSEVTSEIKKTTFPTREQTLGSSIVVIVMVLFMSLFLALADFILSRLVGMILK
jgi:preprotein translocase subunit SecE